MYAFYNNKHFYESNMSANIAERVAFTDGRPGVRTVEAFAFQPNVSILGAHE